MSTRAIETLRPHPLNASIYAGSTQANDDLVTSVHIKGVLTPLLITADGLVISGHRRLDAARRAGLSTVPVTLYGSDDECDILEALIHANRQRDKDGQIIANEAIALEENGQKREDAKRRQQEAAHQTNAVRWDASDEGPEAPSLLQPVAEAMANGYVNGTSRDAIGAAIGVSGWTAEQAAAAERAARILEEAGHAAEAQDLRRVLRRNIKLAYTTARSRGYIQPKRPPKERTEGMFSVEQWLALPDEKRAKALARRNPHARFNEQKTDNIEWARWSWNPVTGCKHDCSYCYARDIAERFYPQGFVPHFLPERLAAPAQMEVPPIASEDIGYRNVFTCSMADLFGKWVPRDWIEAVLAQVHSNPQWNFLFLTKFPLRLAEFDFPSNAWVGTSIDAQARIPNAEKAFANVHGGVKWLSCEPMLERLTFSRLDIFDWVVIGGASRSTQTPEFRPPREWVAHLEAQCAAAGCEVYEKDNLLTRRREYPGQARPAAVNVPAAFKMGYLQRDVLPVTAGRL